MHNLVYIQWVRKTKTDQNPSVCVGLSPLLLRLFVCLCERAPNTHEHPNQQLLSEHHTDFSDKPVSFTNYYVQCTICLRSPKQSILLVPHFEFYIFCPECSNYLAHVQNGTL